MHCVAAVLSEGGEAAAGGPDLLRCRHGQLAVLDVRYAGWGPQIRQMRSVSASVSDTLDTLRQVRKRRRQVTDRQSDTLAGYANQRTYLAQVQIRWIRI